MEKLSVEIWDLMVSNLPPPFASYAAVSRAWQKIFEIKTFSSIHMRNDELEKLDAIFADPRRRALLRNLKYTVELPNISKKRFKKFQGRREGAANNMAYTRAVYVLFERLQAWGEPSSHGISLEITAKAPIDSYIPSSPNNHYGDPAWQWRNMNCWITFDPTAVGPQSLPTVSCVHTLDARDGRQLHPSFVAIYANALPSLRKMWWDFYPPGRRLLSLRRDVRTSLANALLHASFDSLAFLDIYWEDSEPLNQTFPLGDLLEPGSEIDLLSMGVRRISQLPKLQHLILRGCHILSSAAFSLSPTGDKPDNSPLWPSLTTLRMELSATTPDGRWYFTGDPDSAEPTQERMEDLSESECDYNSSDSDKSHFCPDIAWEKLDGDKPMCSFRHQIDPDTFNTFFLAMVRSVRHMPRIRQLEFDMGNMGTDCQVSAKYLAPGEKINWGGDGVTRAFYEEHQMQSRWYIDLARRYDIDLDWKVPLEIKRELIESTSGGDCVLVQKRGNRLEI
ncbi:hypothetical protein AJ80_07107 [Polytolypa hystricis UAMH7299]|uniref:F-box domain-containing protein n=1 Tax=Polytolypa hystricis (strain UAMH7299) TaxID=1447883 RepID=A0A2B7XR53_POLH7|nr:hypothetical protein AJ80_07107 [Polytolypa hystricis UAMH7299]